MKKRLFLIGLAMLLAFAAFAEETEVDKSVGLKDSDVKNFIKNYKQLYKDAENFTSYLATPTGAMNQAVAAAALVGTAEKTLINIMNKNGISGANAFEKFTRINFYTVIAAYDVTMEKTIAENPALAAYIAAASIDPYAEMRKKLNAADFAIIKANINELMRVMELNGNNNDE